MVIKTVHKNKRLKIMNVTNTEAEQHHERY